MCAVCKTPLGKKPNLDNISSSLHGKGNPQHLSLSALPHCPICPVGQASTALCVRNMHIPHPRQRAHIGIVHHTAFVSCDSPGMLCVSRALHTFPKAKDTYKNRAPHCLICPVGQDSIAMCVRKMPTTVPGLRTHAGIKHHTGHDAASKERK